MNRQLIRKAQDLLSKERGTIFKDFGGRISIALVYPNTYYVGMSNLGFQTIYRHLNCRENVVCERAFFPEREDEVELRRTKAPLFSLESQRPLRDFDILAFSVSFENDYINVLKTLELAHLPLKAKDRDEHHPLVMVGGAITFMNPEPLAEFADVVVIGEGEETLDEFLDKFGRSKSRSRMEHLNVASGINGIYIPSLFPGMENIESQQLSSAALIRLRRQTVSDLNRFPTYSAIIAEETEFSNTLLVEISRGCPWRCRFCAAGHIYRPFRSIRPDVILGIVKRQLEEDAKTGLSPGQRIGLVSSAVCDYPWIDRLCMGLKKLGLKISVSSVRMDRLSDVLLQTLVESGLKTLAIAPEAGSERLREVIGKSMSDESILEGIGRIVESGIPNVRLYFMLGLPTETDDDVDQLIDLTLRIRSVMEERGKKPGTLTLSINPFIPKACTPFQWSRMESPATIRKRLKKIKDGLKGIRGIRIKHESLKGARFQAILSRGDRRLGDFLIAVHRLGGNWERAAREISLETDKYLGKIDMGKAQPWDFICGEKEKQNLLMEYVSAVIGDW